MRNHCLFVGWGGLRDYQIYSNTWAAPTGADCRQVLQIKLGCEGSFHKQHLLIKNNRVWVFFYIRKQPLHLFLNGIFQRERNQQLFGGGEGVGTTGGSSLLLASPICKDSLFAFFLYISLFIFEYLRTKSCYFSVWCACKFTVTLSLSYDFLVPFLVYSCKCQLLKRGKEKSV